MHTTLTLSQVGDLGYIIQHSHQIAKSLLCNAPAEVTISNTRPQILFNNNDTNKNNSTTPLKRSNDLYETFRNIGNFVNFSAGNCSNRLLRTAEGNRVFRGEKERWLNNGSDFKFYSS